MVRIRSCVVRHRVRAFITITKATKLCGHKKKKKKTHDPVKKTQLLRISLLFSPSVCLPVVSITAGTADKFPLLACLQFYFTASTLEIHMHENNLCTRANTDPDLLITPAWILPSEVSDPNHRACIELYISFFICLSLKPFSSQSISILAVRET